MDNSVGSMVVKYRKGLDQVLDGLPLPIITPPPTLSHGSNVVTVLDRIVIEG